MEITFADIISVISLLLGGGGVGYLLSWRYNRRKEKAEVEQAETTAAKEMQDMYQQLIEDVKRDRDEQKTYIVELKEDRQHLRQERDDLRTRLEQVEEMVHSLQIAVARNGRMVEAMRPMLCGRRGCKDRVAVTFEGDEMQAKQRRSRKDEKQ